MSQEIRRFTGRAPGGRVVSFMLAGLMVVAATGQAQTRADRDAIAKGRTTYVRYCVSCHGKQAKGDGPLAKDLRVPVPDLTTLALRSGGTYPHDRVVAIVSDGSTVKGHGSNDMPAWGPAFNRTEGTGATTVDEAIRNLSRYLRSVQRAK